MLAAIVLSPGPCLLNYMPKVAKKSSPVGVAAAARLLLLPLLAPLAAPAPLPGVAVLELLLVLRRIAGAEVVAVGGCRLRAAGC